MSLISDANPANISGEVDAKSQVFGAMLLDIFQACFLVLVGMVSVGCVQHLVSFPSESVLKKPFIFGKIEVFQEEKSGRIYAPELASFEFVNKEKDAVYRVDIGSSSSFFLLDLAPGKYEVSRVFIREGGFRSTAEVTLAFEIPAKGIGYVGFWRFIVSPPNFTREVVVKISSQPVEALAELNLRYPSLSESSVESLLAEPSTIRSRLYEITPYPRFRWFNRHNST